MCPHRTQPGFGTCNKSLNFAQSLVLYLAEAGSVPVLLKIAPDLIDADIEAIAALVVEMNLAGMVATNTTISREYLIAESNTRRARRP